MLAAGAFVVTKALLARYISGATDHCLPIVSGIPDHNYLTEFHKTFFLYLHEGVMDLPFQLTYL